MELEIKRLTNAVLHLLTSNTQLKEALLDEPDLELRDAFNENLVVIAKYRWATLQPQKPPGLCWVLQLCVLQVPHHPSVGTSVLLPLPKDTWTHLRLQEGVK